MGLDGEDWSRQLLLVTGDWVPHEVVLVLLDDKDAAVAAIGDPPTLAVECLLRERVGFGCRVGDEASDAAVARAVGVVEEAKQERKSVELAVPAREARIG